MKKVIEDFIKDEYKRWEKSRQNYRTATFDYKIGDALSSDDGFSFSFVIRNMTVRGEDILVFEVFLQRRDPKRYFRKHLFEINNMYLQSGGIGGLMHRIKKNSIAFLEDSHDKADKLLLAYLNGS